jgi:hypothetical protein
MKKKVNVGNLFDAIEKTLSKKPTAPKKPSPKKK